MEANGETTGSQSESPGHIYPHPQNENLNSQVCGNSTPCPAQSSVLPSPCVNTRHNMSLYSLGKKISVWWIGAKEPGQSHQCPYRPFD